jgi:ribosomal protein S18 acetylase RimI-like enzyme
MVIRLAGADDVGAIGEVHVRTWQETYRGHMPDDYLASLDASKRAAMWAQHLTDPTRLLFVALRGTTLVGFCSLVPSRDAGAAVDVAEISAINIDPSSWRSGYGSALIDAVLTAAGERGFKRLTLWVLEGNARARAFYAARGFGADGTTRIVELHGFSLSEVRYQRLVG